MDRLRRLVDHHLGDARLILLIGRRRTPGVRAVGRRHVLLSPELVHEHRTGRISDWDLLALVGHAAGRLHHGRTRFNLALIICTWLWQLVRTIALATGRLVARIPLVTLAWRARIVVGGIAIVLETSEGRVGSAIICGLFIGQSYLMPWWGRRWEAQLTLAADSYVAGHGLGDPLARYLLRHANDPATHDRAGRLRAGTPGGPGPAAGAARVPTPTERHGAASGARGLAGRAPIGRRPERGRGPGNPGPACARPRQPAGWRDHTQPWS